MVYFRWQPATLLQNFIYLRQSAAEILLFVQKFQDGGRRRRGFYFIVDILAYVHVGPPT